MRTLRDFNWGLVFGGVFFVGMGYVAHYVGHMGISEIGGHVRHALVWMLMIPGAFLGYGAFSSLNQNSSLYRGRSQPFRFICENVGYIAVLVLVVATLAVILMIGAGPKESSPQAVRFETITGIVFWTSSAYLLLCNWLIWIRYVVKEDTIVSVNGKFLYPGTKFVLYPWRRYDIALFHRTFGSFDNIPLTVQCADGVYQIAFSTSFAIEIERASTVRNAQSLDTRKVSADIEERIIAHLTEEAQHYTLGQFLKLERDAVRYEVLGAPFIWNGRTAITVK